MKEKIKIYKVCKGGGLAPAAPKSARLCALLKPPAAIADKIRVLFSASPAPLCGGARALQAPHKGGNKTFILLNCFVVPCARPFPRAARQAKVTSCWSTPCVPAHPPFFGGCLPLSAT